MFRPYPNPTLSNLIGCPTCLTRLCTLVQSLRVQTGKEWYVEQILDMRFDASGKKEYLVQWSGTWPQDWRPAYDIEGTASEAIDIFMNKQKGARGQKKRKQPEGSDD